MKASLHIGEFLSDLESYAKDTKFDYTYYLVVYELRRMQIAKRIGGLKPEHMSPILLLLRDWMPAGWVGWSERTKRRWKMDSELCDTLNKLRNEFTTLHALDLEHFEPDRDGSKVKGIFEKIYALKLGVSEKAIATVTSKIMHLVAPKLFVMWDTGIIDFYRCKPNAEGYLTFLVEMTNVAKQLQRNIGRIRQKAEELRKRAGEVYGIEICSEKSLAKLIDESNWMKTRRTRYQSEGI